MATANDTEDKIKQLENEIKVLEKETAKVKLEKEKAEFNKERIAAEMALEVETLKREKEKAEYEQAIAEAKRAQDLAELTTEKERAELEKDKAAAKRAQELGVATTVKDKSELEKGKAEADRAIFSTMIPKSEVKALEGKTTIDDKVSIEANILAHEAVSKIAVNITKRLKRIIDNNPSNHTNSSKNIIIHNQGDLSNVLNNYFIRSEIDYILKKYEILLSDTVSLTIPPLLLPELATGVIKSIIDVVSLFRTDTEIKGKEFSIEEAALIAELANSSEPGLNIIYPSIYPPGLIPENGSESLLEKVGKLSEFRHRAENDLEIFNNKSDQDKTKDKLNGKVSELKALFARHDKLHEVFVARDEKTGLNGLAQLLRSMTLLQKLKEGYLLFVKILASGGNNITERNLFTGTKLSHSGGSIVTYFLFDSGGIIKSSGVLYSYGGKKTPEEISQISLDKMRPPVDPKNPANGAGQTCY